MNQAKSNKTPNNNVAHFYKHIHFLILSFRYSLSFILTLSYALNNNPAAQQLSHFRFRISCVLLHPPSGPTAAHFARTNITNNNKINKAEWDFSKHWLAVTSIILILGAAGVAVPLALRVSSGQYFSSKEVWCVQNLSWSAPIKLDHRNFNCIDVSWESTVSGHSGFWTCSLNWIFSYFIDACAPWRTTAHCIQLRNPFIFASFMRWFIAFFHFRPHKTFPYPIEMAETVHIFRISNADTFPSNSRHVIS